MVPSGGLHLPLPPNLRHNGLTGRRLRDLGAPDGVGDVGTAGRFGDLGSPEGVRHVGSSGGVGHLGAVEGAGPGRRLRIAAPRGAWLP
jgi:hypothetical protein